jgi:pyridinium-3,5-biscarboxylic acid mononucleotide sulfurtransferase
MKEAELMRLLAETKKFYLLFSGGFDSSAILGCAVKAGADVTPVWIDNGFNRAGEWHIRQQAENLGCTSLRVIQVNPTNQVLSNPVDRCFFCKGELALPVVKMGDAPVFDGTNASDQGTYRPGLKALRDLGVRSPLQELNITKDESVEMAVMLGADPVLANMEGCLATRFNYGEPITQLQLDTIRKMEQAMIEKTGDYHVRCRIDDKDHVRIECRSQSTFMMLMEPAFRNEMVELGRNVATFVTLDLEGARKNMFDKMRNL